MDEIRDGVEYYIDNNQEDDFYEDEELYTDLVGSRDLLSPRDSQDGMSGDEEGAEDSAALEEGSNPTAEQEAVVTPSRDEQAESDRHATPTLVELPPGSGKAPTSHASLRSSQIDLKNYSAPAETPQGMHALRHFVFLTVVYPKVVNPPRAAAKDAPEAENLKRSKDRTVDSNQVTFLSSKSEHKPVSEISHLGPLYSVNCSCRRNCTPYVFLHALKKRNKACLLYALLILQEEAEANILQKPANRLLLALWRLLKACMAVLEAFLCRMMLV